MQLLGWYSGETQQERGEGKCYDIDVYLYIYSWVLFFLANKAIIGLCDMWLCDELIYYSKMESIQSMPINAVVIQTMHWLLYYFSPNGTSSPKKNWRLPWDIYIYIYQVLPSDPFGDFKWPFQGLSDLHFGLSKGHLEEAGIWILMWKPFFVENTNFLQGMGTTMFYRIKTTG